MDALRTWLDTGGTLLQALGAMLVVGRGYLYGYGPGPPAEDSRGVRLERFLSTYMTRRFFNAQAARLFTAPNRRTVLRPLLLLAAPILAYGVLFMGVAVALQIWRGRWVLGTDPLGFVVIAIWGTTGSLLMLYLFSPARASGAEPRLALLLGRLGRNLPAFIELAAGLFGLGAVLELLAKLL